SQGCLRSDLLLTRHVNIAYLGHLYVTFKIVVCLKSLYSQGKCPFEMMDSAYGIDINPAF
ncbi:MAG: hypothetical protein AAFZ92_03485, partial [Pseudomonadota bacterium]